MNTRSICKKIGFRPTAWMWISQLIIDVGLLLYFYYIVKEELCNLWISVPQIIVLIPILWFSNKTVGVLCEEIREQQRNGTGAIPIIALGYMGFAVYYTSIFIKQFGFVLKYNECIIKTILDKTRPDVDYDWYLISVKSFICLIFIAFVTNFYKSFFTLNSLEYGQFCNELTLKSIFQSKKKWVFIEVVLRIIIAILFIFVEKKLAESTNVIENFTEIGKFIVFLYGFMFFWLLYMWCFTKKRIVGGWFKATFWQFILGVIIGLIFWELGGVDYLNDVYAFDKFLASFIACIAAAFGVLIAIIINESRHTILISDDGASAR